MFNFNLWDFPNKIKQDVAYILYYIINAYIPMLLVVMVMLKMGLFPHKLDDYQFFMIALMYSAIIGYAIWLVTTTPEKKMIKRNHFVAGLIQVLQERWKLSFAELRDKYGYCVFGNSDITLYWKDYAKTLVVLINLGIIELANESELQKGPDEFDFKYFQKNLDNMVFRLRLKKIDLDELTRKVQNYLF